MSARWLARQRGRRRDSQHPWRADLLNQAQERETGQVRATGPSLFAACPRAWPARECCEDAEEVRDVARLKRIADIARGRRGQFDPPGLSFTARDRVATSLGAMTEVGHGISSVFLW